MIIDPRHLTNPANPARQPDGAVLGITQSNWKAGVLALCALASVFGFGYYLNLFFAADDGWNFLGISSALALGFLSFFLLNVILIRSEWQRGFVSALSCAAFFAAFWKDWEVGFIGAWAAAFLILVYADRAGKLELENLLTIKFWRVGKRVLPKAVMALALLASASYYFNIQEFNLRAPEKFFISEKSFEQIFFPAGTFVKKIIPQFDLDLTTDEILAKIAEDEVAGNPLFKNLPKSAQKPLINQAVGALQKDVAGLIGVPLDTKVRVPETIYRVLVRKILDLPENVRSALPLGAALLVFLAILGFTWLIRWIATIIAFVIYEILLFFGFAEIGTEITNKEVVVLK